MGKTCSFNASQRVVHGSGVISITWDVRRIAGSQAPCQISYIQVLQVSPENYLNKSCGWFLHAPKFKSHCVTDYPSLDSPTETPKGPDR